jgi:hypothetical protein
LEFIRIPNDEVQAVGESVSVEIAAAPSLAGRKFEHVPLDEIEAIHEAIQVGVSQKIIPQRNLAPGVGAASVGPIEFCALCDLCGQTKPRRSGYRAMAVSVSSV